MRLRNVHKIAMKASMAKLSDNINLLMSSLLDIRTKQEITRFSD
jgi:hypothetical protein